eukprot:8990218-Karenia_brevis.AAC.1
MQIVATSGCSAVSPKRPKMRYRSVKTKSGSSTKKKPMGQNRTREPQNAIGVTQNRRGCKLWLHAVVL